MDRTSFHFLIGYPISRHQLHIQFHQNLLIIIPEHLIEPSQAALAVEGTEIQILRFYAEGRSDVVLDEPQPLHLLVGEVDGPGVAAEGPLLEIVVDPLGKGRQCLRRTQLEANQRDKVGQLQRRIFLYLVRLPDGIAVPQPLPGDTFRSQLLIQRFELGNCHRPVLVPLVVDDTQGGDLVLIFSNKFSKRPNCPAGGLLLADVVPGI